MKLMLLCVVVIAYVCEEIDGVERKSTKSFREESQSVWECPESGFMVICGMLMILQLKSERGYL